MSPSNLQEFIHGALLTFIMFENTDLIVHSSYGDQSARELGEIRYVYNVILCIVLILDGNRYALEEKFDLFKAFEREQLQIGFFLRKDS